MSDLLAVALGHYTTPHSTIALGHARAQIIGGHLLGAKALRYGWWERKWVPIPFVGVIHGNAIVDHELRMGAQSYPAACGEQTIGEPINEHRGGRALGYTCKRRRLGWRRMSTDGTSWWDSDFPDPAYRARMVRQHLASAIQAVREATGYDRITEENLDDAGRMVCPATWHGLLLCKRVLEIAAIPPRAAEAAE